MLRESTLFSGKKVSISRLLLTFLRIDIAILYTSSTKLLNYFVYFFQAAEAMCPALNLKAGLLLQLLTSLRQQLQGSHLAQLLLRLMTS
jgi:hypothetical protein